MPTDRDLADRAASAYAATARTHPGLDRRGALDDSGGLLRRATGSAVPFFSWLYVLDDGVSDDELVDAVGWFDARDQPFTVRLRDHQARRYAGTLRGLGFDPEVVMPGMVAAPVPDPGGHVPGLVIARATEAATYDAFTARIPPGDPDHWLTTAVYRDFMPLEIVADPTSAYFVGTLGDDVVATSAANVHDGVVVVFAVSTAESVRRRGIGTAMTAAALRWGRDAGADLAFLTSSQMAMGLYGAMGFRTVDTWHFYVRRWAGSAPR